MSNHSTSSAPSRTNPQHRRLLQLSRSIPSVPSPLRMSVAPTPSPPAAQAYSQQNSHAFGSNFHVPPAPPSNSIPVASTSVQHGQPYLQYYVPSNTAPTIYSHNAINRSQSVPPTAPLNAGSRRNTPGGSAASAVKLGKRAGGEVVDEAASTKRTRVGSGSQTVIHQDENRPSSRNQAQLGAPSGGTDPTAGVGRSVAEIPAPAVVSAGESVESIEISDEVYAQIMDSTLGTNPNAPQEAGPSADIDDEEFQRLLATLTRIPLSVLADMFRLLGWEVPEN